MQFIEITKEQKKVLLNALDMPIEPKTRGCEFCLTPLTYDNVSIMPPIFKERAILICNNAICMSEYLTMIEENIQKKEL